MLRTILLLIAQFNFLNSIEQKSNQTNDIISQEIHQLTVLIDLQQQKLAKLIALREALINDNFQVPQIDEYYLNKVFQHSSAKQQQQHLEQKTHAEYQKTNDKQLLVRSFNNRVLKKFQFSLEENAKFSQIIQIQQYRTQQDMSSQLILVVITKSNDILLYDNTGNYLNRTEIDQKEIQFLTAGNRADDPIFATYGEGQISIFRIESKRINAHQKNEQEDSSFQIKWRIYASMEMQFNLFEDIINITDFEYSMIKGNRYFIFSDDQGGIHVYHRNGTYHGKKVIAEFPIVGLQKSFPYQLYATQQKFGYFNPTNMEVVQPFCDPLPYPIIQMIPDIQQSNIIYVLTLNGEIYVYEIKFQEGICQIKQHYQYQTNSSPQTHQLLSLRYFLLLIDRNSKLIMAFNTSDILSDEVQLGDPLMLTFLGNNSDTVVDISVTKGFQNSHFILVQENDLYNDKSQLAYYEIMLPVKKDGGDDFMQNFRFPIIIVGLILAFAYQSWRKGGKKSNHKKEKGNRNYNTEKQIEELLSGSKYDTQNKTGGVGGAVNQRKVENLKQSIDQIDKKAKQMSELMAMRNQNSQRSAAVNKKYD